MKRTSASLKPSSRNIVEWSSTTDWPTTCRVLPDSKDTWNNHWSRRWQESSDCQCRRSTRSTRLELLRIWRGREEKYARIAAGGFYGQNTTDLHERIQATGSSAFLKPVERVKHK